MRAKKRKRIIWRGFGYVADFGHGEIGAQQDLWTFPGIEKTKSDAEWYEIARPLRVKITVEEAPRRSKRT